MYRRASYTAVLAVAIAGLEVSAAFGRPPQPAIAYVFAVALGGVVFYQSEARVTSGSMFGNVLLAAAAGTIGSHVVIAGMLTYVLGVPPDFTLWQAGVLLWDSWAGILTAILGGFFVTGVVASLAK